MKDIVITTGDGRELKGLYQWDINQKICISGIETSPLPEIHFWACRLSKALVVPTQVHGDKVIADVPNILLQVAEPITIFIYKKTGEDGHRTSDAILCPVRARPQPEEYEYQDNIEYTSWVELTAEARELIDQIDEIVAGMSDIADQASAYATSAGNSASSANTAKLAAELAQGKAEDAQAAAETAQGKAEDAKEAAEAVLESIPEDYDTLENTMYNGTPLIDYAVRDLNYTGTPGKSDSTCLAVKRRGSRIVLNGGNINNASKPNVFVKLTGNTIGRTINSSTIRNWSDGITLKSGRMYKVTVLYVSGETSAVSVPATSLSVDNLGESATIGYASRDGHGRYSRYFVATQELNLILYVPCYQITYTDYTVDVILEEVNEVDGKYLPSMVTNTALAVGDFRIVDNELFRVTVPVASGGTLSPGTNCVKTTLSGEIDTLNDTVDGLNGEVDALESDVTDTQSMLATVEADSTASKEYAIGDLLVFEGKLYRAVSAISLGDTLIPDGNIELTTVEQQLASFGGGAVDDVQINGTSIVDAQGAANIPIGDSNTLGLVKRAGTGYSVNIEADGSLQVVGADTATIKLANTNSKRPIVPSTTGVAAFYGLAKAAGDTTQSNSSNAVGTYTDEAKSAIREMLGIPNFQSEVIYEGTVSEDSEIVGISLDSNGQPFELRAFKILLELGASTTGNADWITARMTATTPNDVDFLSVLPTKKMSATTGSLIVYEFETYPGGKMWFTRAYAGRYNSTLGGIETYCDKVVGIKSVKGFEFRRYSSSSTLIPAGSKITIIGIRA